MKTTVLAFVFAGCVVPAFAQPAAAPPPVLQVIRETIKEGKGAAHRRAEQAYAAAFRKNKYPYHYIGLTTEAGTNEAWFLSAYPSFAAMEDNDKLSSKDPLKTDLEVVEARDGEFRVSSRTMTAVFRPDMSYQPANGVALAKTRYLMIGTYRVRLGHEEDFMAGGKMILDANKKAGLDTPVLTYQVIAGVPEGLYLLMFPMASLKELDDQPAREKAMVSAMGEENFRRLMKGTGDVFQTMETTIFAVSPEMSYVSKETEDAAPGFWRPKSSAAAPKAKEKATDQ